jgi:hypothetical protein
MKGAASDVPLEGPVPLNRMRSEASADPSVQVRRLDINGYSATDILRFSAQDGREVLYVPGQAQAFREFETEDQLRNWVTAQARDPATRRELTSHFSIYDRSKGNFGAFSATGVNEALDNLASGKWGKDYIDTQAGVVYGDAFTDMMDRTRQRASVDLVQINGDSDKRRMWLDDLKNTDSLPLSRPVARALSAWDFAADASSGKGLWLDNAAGMDVGLTLLFAPIELSSSATPPRAEPLSPFNLPPASSTSQHQPPAEAPKLTRFDATEFPPRSAADAINEINDRIRSITGQQMLQTYDSMKDLEKSSYASEDKTGLERLKNSLEEVYRRLNAANERLHDPTQQNQILAGLGKSLNTTDQRAQTQACDRLRGMAQEALQRFASFRNAGYKNVTFFQRPDKSQPLPEEAENNPVPAFVNMKDRSRLMINLDGPDKARHTLSDSQASKGYNIELVDSVMNQVTRLAGDTQDYMRVSKEATRDGFSLGTAANALEQFQHGVMDDALCQRVLGKAPDYPDDTWVRKTQGLKGDEPITDELRVLARFKYMGMNAQARKDIGEPASWTYSDHDRDWVSGRIRGDDVLRADLMTSNADTAALYLRDIAARRNYDMPLPGAESQTRSIYEVHDAAGTIHFFPTQEEAETYRDGAFKRGFSSGMKNPVGSVMKIIGRAAGAAAATNERLAEIGDKPIGELFAATGKAAGVSEGFTGKLKSAGGAVEYLIPLWGQVRFYGKLAGKAVDGEAPSPNDVINVLGDQKNMASGAGRNIRPEPEPVEKAPESKPETRSETKPETKPSRENKPADRDSTQSSTKYPPQGQSMPWFKPPQKLPDGRTGYPAGPTEPPRLPDKDTASISGTGSETGHDKSGSSGTSASSPGGGNTGLGIQLTADNVDRELPGLTPQGRQNAARYLGDRKNPVPVVRNPQDIENATHFFNEGGKLNLSGGAPGSDGSSQPKRPRLYPDDGQQPSTSGNTASVHGGITIPDSLRDKILAMVRGNPHLADSTVAAIFAVPESAIADLRERYGVKRTPGHYDGISRETRDKLSEYIVKHGEESDINIATWFGVSGSLVQTIRQELGIPRKGPRLPYELKAQILDYIRRNINDFDENAAKMFDVSRQTINRLRHDYGLQKARGTGIPLSTERKIEIRDYMLERPYLNNADIARRFGISHTTTARIRNDPGFVEAPARAPAPLPKGLDLEAPLSPNSQQKVKDIQDELSGARPGNLPGATTGSSVPAQPSGQSDLSQYVDADAPASESLQRNVQLIWEELAWINPDEPTNPDMIRWMAKNLSPEALQRLANLPDTQLETEFGLLRQRMNLPEAGAAPAPATPPSGSSSTTSSGSSSPSVRGNADAPPSLDREPQRAQIGKEPPSSPTHPDDTEEVIDWLQAHRTTQEVERILDLPEDEFEAEITRARQEMHSAAKPHAGSGKPK